MIQRYFGSRHERGAFIAFALLVALFVEGGGDASWAQAERQLPQAPQPANAGTLSERGDYLLQRGDELEIKVFNFKDLDAKVRIRPDGKISVMLLDDVVAAGLTSAQLDEVLTAGYAKLYRDPKLTVVVTSFSNQKVYVAGEVTTPGVVNLIGDMTALGAVSHAGGFKETAKINDVILLRNNGGGQAIVTKLKLKDVLSAGKPDTPLMPFDVIFVPKTPIAKIDTFFKQYIRDIVSIGVSGNFVWVLGQGGGTVVTR